jgi:hypothetical protein
MGRKQAQAIIAALISWPALAQEYNPVAIPGQIIGSPETMAPLNGGDDSTRLVQLSFPFEYFGQTFSSVYVSTNGFVSFENIGHLCCNGTPIEQAPRNAIYGLWSDLISGGNPYFRSNANEAVFGWYNTFEYGTSLTNTFEIALFPDGKVQWNYVDVNNQYHLVTAGLTGPASTDNVALYYGQNPNLLDGTSYVALSAPPPAPEPEPPFQPVDAAPSIIESPIAQQEAIEAQEAEQAVQEVVAEQEAEIAEAEAIETPLADEPLAEEPEAQEAIVEDEAEAAVETASEATLDAERLSPEELAALAGDSESQEAEASAPQTEQLTLDAGTIEQAATEAQQGAQDGLQAGQDEQHGNQEGQQTTLSASGDQSRADEARQSQSQAQDKAANTSEASPEGRRERFDDDLALDPIKAADVLAQAAIAGDGKGDKNVQFFQLEAIEDADLFERERVAPVSLQDAATVAVNNAELAKTNGEQATVETPAGAYEITILDGPTFGPAPVTGMGDFASPVGQTQQMELLGMNGMQGEMASGQPFDIGDINSDDKEAMTQLAAVPPGYSGYTQLRLPDAPFYEPRDIYRGRRIPDANMALYRMMSGQDARWQEMVDHQYE